MVLIFAVNHAVFLMRLIPKCRAQPVCESQQQRWQWQRVNTCCLILLYLEQMDEGDNQGVCVCVCVCVLTWSEEVLSPSVCQHAWSLDT